VSWEPVGKQKIFLPPTLVVGPFASGRDGAIARFGRPRHVRSIEHVYPSPSECLACHNPSAGSVLGVNTRQLNRVGPGASPQNQLELLGPVLDHRIEPGAVSRLERMVAADDGTAPLELRARSYLDANCGFCHRPENMAQLAMDLRFETPLAASGLLGGSTRWNSGPLHRVIIAPHNPWRSELYARISRTSDYSMPPIGRATVDRTGPAMIRAWIESLPGEPGLEPPAIRIRPDAPGAIVELGHPDPGAAIYYTLDDSTPTRSSGVRYRQPFRARSGTVVRARAYRDGYADAINDDVVP
jgi:hypothetical protein